jgi:hypothetical protein
LRATWRITFNCPPRAVSDLARTVGRSSRRRVLGNADEEFRPLPRVATTQANIGGRVVIRRIAIANVSSARDKSAQMQRPRSQDIDSGSPVLGNSRMPVYLTYTGGVATLAAPHPQHRFQS